MEIFTDKRSEKYHELELNNNVEICWLFSRSKCQFRLRGISRICLGNKNLSHWEKLNKNSKLMWSWPNPRDHHFMDRKYDFESKQDLKLNKNFILLTVNITHVDQLILKKPIHTRRRWIKRGEWIEERINP